MQSATHSTIVSLGGHGYRGYVQHFWFVLLSVDCMSSEVVWGRPIQLLPPPHLRINKKNHFEWFWIIIIMRKNIFNWRSKTVDLQFFSSTFFVDFRATIWLNMYYRIFCRIKMKFALFQDFNLLQGLWWTKEKSGKRPPFHWARIDRRRLQRLGLVFEAVVRYMCCVYVLYTYTSEIWGKTRKRLCHSQPLLVTGLIW